MTSNLSFSFLLFSINPCPVFFVLFSFDSFLILVTFDPRAPWGICHFLLRLLALALGFPRPLAIQEKPPHWVPRVDGSHR